MLMYLNLSEIPAFLLKFYEEHITKMLTGNKIPKEIDGFDSHGNPTTIIVMVDEITDHIEVIERSRGECNTWNKVLSLAACGKPKHVIKIFIGYAINADKWAFFDEYKEWELNTPDSDDKEFYTPNEDGSTSFNQEAFTVACEQWSKSEPKPPVLPTVEQWMIDNYSPLRDGIYPPVKQQLEWQLDDLINGTNFWLENQNEVRMIYQIREAIK